MSSSSVQDTQTAENVHSPVVPQVTSTADDGGIANAQDDQTPNVSGTSPAAGDDENSQE
jgi:hypothetical protein